ncbi:MAG: response regulator [Acidobacteriaceae bacterium]
MVETSWHDLVLMSYVLDEEGLRGSVHAVRSGEEALAFLDSVRHAELPNVLAMIVDLSLPDMHGSELVDAVRHDAVFRNLPIVVFSGSTRSLSEAQKRLLRGASVVEKPVAFSEFQRTFISLLRSLLSEQPEAQEVPA